MVDKPHKKHTSQDAHQATDNMLFPISDEEIEQAEEDHDEQQYELTHKRKINLRGRWKRTATYNKVIALAAVLSAASTLAYAIFALLQWSAMDAQLRELKSGSGDTHALAVAAGQQAAAAKAQSEQAKAQTDKMAEALARTDKLIKATNDLAVQAKRTADIGRDSLAESHRISRIDQRPWVFASKLQFTSQPEIGKSSSVNVWFYNPGKTPAFIKLNQSVIAFWDKEPTEPPFPYANLPNGNGMVATVLPPNFQGMHLTTDTVFFDAQRMAKYKDGAFNVYVFFYVEYEDIFGERHLTKVCAYHSATLSEDEWFFCKNGNSVDHPERGDTKQ